MGAGASRLLDEVGTHWAASREGADRLAAEDGMGGKGLTGGV